MDAQNRRDGVRGVWRWLVVMLFVPLLAGAGDQIPADKQGSYAIPKMSHAPKIDGTIDPVEWREALAIGGLASQNPGGNLLIMRPTTYYLAWDADNLYVACRTWIMPGYKPRVSGRAPGTVNAFDDGMEFNLKPMGANVAEGRADSCYKFFAVGRDVPVHRAVDACLADGRDHGRPEG